MNFLRYLIITSFILLLMACGGAEERKAAYLEKADQSIKAGDLEKARIELKNVLQIDPKDAAAFYKLGNIFERQKDYKKAFANYSKAEELAPENLEYHAKLGRFYLVLAGDVEKAKEELALIQKTNKDDINGLQLEAGILLKEKKTSEARAISEDIFSRHPENVENAIFLSTLLSNEKNYKQAITILEDALSHNPKDILLMGFLANTLFIDKDYTKTESVLKEILDAYPDNYGNHVKLALFYQKTGKADLAEQVLKNAIELNQKDVARKLSYIDYIQQTKGTEVAITELQAMIKENPSEGDLRLLLAKFQSADNQIDAAIKTYKDAINKFSNEATGVKSRTALAIIYMQKGEVGKAVNIINEAAEVSPNDADVSLVKAKIALVNKDLEQAIISLRTVIKDAPENAEAYILLAGAHKANNEPQQADDIIARAYENNRSNADALLVIAKYYIQNKNVSEAEKVIDDCLRLVPDNYDALSIKTAILNEKKNYAAAKVEADKIIALYPDKENGYIQSVPALVVEKNYTAAYSLLESGYEKTGKNLKILKTLAELEIVTGKADHAIARLSKEIDSSNDEQVWLLTAKAYMAINDIDSAITTLRKAIRKNPQYIQSYLTLAAYFLKQNNNSEAVSVLIQGGDANKTDLNTRLMLAGLYEKNGEFDKSIAVYDSMLALDESNIIVTNNLAALLVDHKDDEASLKRAVKLVEKLKDAKQPVIRDTVGWVYYKMGDYSDATRILGEVVSAMPDIDVFNYHLGMALVKSGNKPDAKKYLEKAINGKSDFTGKETAKQTLDNL